MSDVSEVKVRNGLFSLYDQTGDFVGRVNTDMGRALIGYAFYVKERTCHNFGGEEGTVGEDYDFACSACVWCGDVTEPNYCPNCGAKVVDE